MKRILLFLSLSSVVFGLSAANIPITLVGTTPQQAEIQYTSTIAGACTIGLTDNSPYGVTVWDVSSKFSNSTYDLGRPDSPETGTSGLSRRVILGHRSAEQGNDGNIYSRSLEADAPHTVTVTCGSDSGTLQFATRTIPLGTAYPVLPQYCAGGLEGHCDPTIDWTVTGKDKAYVDPLTGVVVKRVTGPGEEQGGYSYPYPYPWAGNAPWLSFSGAKDQSGTSAWSNINNALTYNGGTYASTSTNGSALFLGFGHYGTANLTGSYYPSALGYLFNISVDDMVVQLFCSASSGDTVSLCLTADGQTCWSTTITRSPGTEAGAVAFGDSTGPSGNGSGTWPVNPWTGPFAGWGNPITPPIPTHLIAATPVSATVNGTVVSIVGLSHPGSDYRGLIFDNEMAAGSPLKIPTSSCTNNICTVASVTDTGHLIIRESQGNLGTQTVQPMNAGVLIWKASGSGTLSLNAQFGFAHSNGFSTAGSGLLGFGGLGEQCSRLQTTTSVNSSGTSYGGGVTHSGNMCQFSTYTLHFWDTTAGSDRFIASNRYGNIYGSGGSVGLGTNPFDFTSASTWYSYPGPSAGWGSAQGRFFIKSVYSGNYARSGITFPSSALDSTSGFTVTYPYGPSDLATAFSTLLSTSQWSTLGTTYSSGTSATTTGTAIANGTTTITWVSGVHFDTTGAWAGKTIAIGGSNYTISSVTNATTLVTTANVTSGTGVAYSVTAPGLWPTFPLYKGNFKGSSSAYALFFSQFAQDTVSWVFPYDIVNQRFTGIINTYSGNPGCTGTAGAGFPIDCGRWGSWHTAQPTGGQNYSWVSTSSLPGISSPGYNTSGPYVMPITQVWRSSDGVNGSGSNGGWDNNTCVPDAGNSKSCTAGNGGTVQYAYNCPAGSSGYWHANQTTANSIYANAGLTPPSPYAGQKNCIQVMVSGPPCTIAGTTLGNSVFGSKIGTAEIAFNPCSSNATTQGMLQDIQVGDTIMDGVDNSSSPSLPCFNCDQMTIAQISGSYPNKHVWLYRAYEPFDGSWNPYNSSGGSVSGKLAHLDGWGPRMQAGTGHDWFTDFSNPASWTVGIDIGANHPTIGAAAISPGIFGNYATTKSGTMTAQLINTITDLASLAKVVETGYNQNFNGTAAVVGSIETYLSQTAPNATNNLKKFVSDYRTPQTGDADPGQLYKVTATLVGGAGHTNVYLITNPVTGVYDFKNAPWYGVSGRWLLRDISGPASSINDFRPSSFCYAYQANQCVSGSSANSLYVNAPFIEPSYTCWGQAWNFSAPCVAPAYGIWGQSMIHNALDPDPTGANFMRLTGLFNPPFLSQGFEAAKFSPDGQWLFYQSWNAGGYRSDIFAARVPNIATDTVNRTTFVQVPVRVPAGNSVAIRFGYDTSFRCHGVSDSQGNWISGYNDSCLTVAAPSQAMPFMFSTEGAVSPVTCTGGCTVNIPSISGRYLYYRVERYSSGGGLTYVGPVQWLPVP
jgi:hypothetical protein